MGIYYAVLPVALTLLSFSNLFKSNYLCFPLCNYGLREVWGQYISGRVPTLHAEAPPPQGRTGKDSCMNPRRATTHQFIDSSELDRLIVWPWNKAAAPYQARGGGEEKAVSVWCHSQSLHFITIMSYNVEGRGFSEIAGLAFWDARRIIRCTQDSWDEKKGTLLRVFLRSY